jgi:hypothetical protein
MVMTVNEGQTAAMQQVLMRFWEELARQKDWLFDEAKKSFSAEQESPEPPNIKMQVYRQGQLIYGAQDGPPIESIDPRFVGQLEVLQSLGVGTQVATAAGIRVEALVKQGGQEVTRQTLFQTDETGTVKINILSPPIERKTGLDVVREHLSALKEESVREESLYLKSLLLEIKQLYSAQEKMFGLIDQQQQDLKELRQQRLLQPHQPNWWQRLGNRWKSFDESFKRAHQEREGAKALLALFRREVEPDGKLFEGMEYAIARDGSRYSFRERQGTELMRFEVNQSGGIVVESSQLQPRQLEELAQLRENLRSVSDLPASFASRDTLARKRSGFISSIAGLGKPMLAISTDRVSLSLLPLTQPVFGFIRLSRASAAVLSRRVIPSLDHAFTRSGRNSTINAASWNRPNR